MTPIRFREEYPTWAYVALFIGVVLYVLRSFHPFLEVIEGSYFVSGTLYFLLSRKYQPATDVGIAHMICAGMAFVVLWPVFFLATRE